MEKCWAFKYESNSTLGKSNDTPWVEKKIIFKNISCSWQRILLVIWKRTAQVFHRWMVEWSLKGKAQAHAQQWENVTSLSMNPALKIWKNTETVNLLSFSLPSFLPFKIVHTFLDHLSVHYCSAGVEVQNITWLCGKSHRLSPNWQNWLITYKSIGLYVHEINYLMRPIALSKGGRFILYLILDE